MGYVIVYGYWHRKIVTIHASGPARYRPLTLEIVHFSCSAFFRKFHNLFLEKPYGYSHNKARHNTAENRIYIYRILAQERSDIQQQDSSPIQMQIKWPRQKKKKKKKEEHTAPRKQNRTAQY